MTQAVSEAIFTPLTSSPTEPSQHQPFTMKFVELYINISLLL